MSSYAVGRHRAPGRTGGRDWTAAYLIGGLYLAVSTLYLVMGLTG